MRKIISVLLSSLIVASSIATICSAAEAVDLGSMDYESLIELQNNLKLEINSRPEAQPIVLKEGKYTVGVDVPAGTYNVVISYSDGNDSVAINVAENQQIFEEDSHNTIVDEWFHLTDDPFKVELNDGNYLCVYFGNVMLKAADFTEDELYHYEAPEGTDVPVGSYKVGDEIPEGKYNAYASDISDNVRIYLYKHEEDYKADGRIRMNFDFVYDILPDVPVPLDLYEGYIVVVDGKDVIMQKRSALEFN